MIVVQPKSLKFLFFAESIQRHSLYGIQSILLLFLVNSLSYSIKEAYSIYGVFIALCFILAILGGFLADRWLGFRRVVLLGILLSLLGNIILIFNIKLLTTIGLASVLCGFGLFLPNNSSLLGTFYDVNDNRRSRGFTLFYIGTNIGGLIGPVTYGILSAYGWHYPFIISTFFLISWIILYWKFSDLFKNHGVEPGITINNKTLGFLIFPCFAVLLVIVTLLLKHPSLAGKVIAFIGISSFLFILVDGLKRKGKERIQVVLLIMMILCSLMFFVSVFQIYTSLLLFIDQYVDRSIIGWKIPPSIFTSLEPFFIIMLAPVVARIWKQLSNKSRELPPLTKMVLGLLLGGCGFGIFTLAAHHAIYVNNISALWIVLGNFFLGLGELCIMPTIISAITQYAPKTIKSTMMGMLYLALAFSGYLSSLIGRLTVGQGSYTQPIIYFNVYNKIFFFTIFIAIFILIILTVVRVYKSNTVLYTRSNPIEM